MQADGCDVDVLSVTPGISSVAVALWWEHLFNGEAVW